MIYLPFSRPWWNAVQTCEEQQHAPFLRLAAQTMTLILSCWYRLDHQHPWPASSGSSAAAAQPPRLVGQNLLLLCLLLPRPLVLPHPLPARGARKRRATSRPSGLPSSLSLSLSLSLLLLRGGSPTRPLCVPFFHSGSRRLHLEIILSSLSEIKKRLWRESLSKKLSVTGRPVIRLQYPGTRL